MRLDTEMRLQAVMIVSTVVGIVGVIGLLIATLVTENYSFLSYAIGLILLVLVVAHFGNKRAQVTMARVQKIREGGGDKADLEWLKTRSK